MRGIASGGELRIQACGSGVLRKVEPSSGRAKIRLPNFAGIVPTHDAVHQLASELLALHAVEPEAARARLGELFALRDRLVAELRALREAVLRSGFNTAQEGVG